MITLLPDTDRARALGVARAGRYQDALWFENVLRDGLLPAGSIVDICIENRDNYEQGYHEYLEELVSRLGFRTLNQEMGFSRSCAAVLAEGHTYTLFHSVASNGRELVKVLYQPELDRYLTLNEQAALNAA